MFYILIAILKLFAHTNRIICTYIYICIYVLRWSFDSRERDSSVFLVILSGPETNTHISECALYILGNPLP
jgi:hypothetical protein